MNLLQDPTELESHDQENIFSPGKFFSNEWMDLSEDFQWMLCKTNFSEYILQSNAYKTTEFLFTYFAFFDFLT